MYIFHSKRKLHWIEWAIQSDARKETNDEVTYFVAFDHHFWCYNLNAKCIWQNWRCISFSFSTSRMTQFLLLFTFRSPRTTCGELPFSFFTFHFFYCSWSNDINAKICIVLLLPFYIFICLGEDAKARSHARCLYISRRIDAFDNDEYQMKWSYVVIG